jgi:HSP20 family molecular chaperone IbpA
VVPLNNERVPGTGNIRYEPPVRQIIEVSNIFQIVADFPGIDEGSIRINLENNILTLAWTDRTMKRQESTIRLPCRTRFVKKKFRVGILEISLEKTENKVC